MTMTLRLVAAAVLLGAAAPASAMTVAAFMVKADSLKKKGPLALFSRDLKLLTNQIKADGAAIRAERLAAKAAGTAQAFCPPEAGVKLSDNDVMQAMQAIPVAERGRTTTRTAMRAFMARRFPCRRG